MIRDIVLSDIEEVYALGKEYDNLFHKKYDLNSYIESNIYIMKCYEVDGHVVAFIIATKLYESIEILLLYVNESYRNKGIGTSLLKALEEVETENILLEVSVQNTAAINLYKKLNYNIQHTRKGYYNGIDAYIMRKELR